MHRRKKSTGPATLRVQSRDCDKYHEVTPQAKKKGCPECGGMLDVPDTPRLKKPRVW